MSVFTAAVKSGQYSEQARDPQNNRVNNSSKQPFSLSKFRNQNNLSKSTISSRHDAPLHKTKLHRTHEVVKTCLVKSRCNPAALPTVTNLMSTENKAYFLGILADALSKAFSFKHII